jgi:N-methylhydantoinase A
MSQANAMSVGFDVGGTFTDCCLAVDGALFSGKSPTTHGQLADGVLGALEAACKAAGVTPHTVLGTSDRTVHGTTIATNAVVERNGARTGLITTRGHGDVMLIMRGAGRTAGLRPEAMLQASRSSKPEPIVPRTLIQEVAERVDWKGQVIVPLDLDDARRAVERLAEQGCESIAISFLWSFQNPEHELAVAELAREILPQAHVALGSQVAPLWGEYERTVAAVLNAYTGPIVGAYLGELERRTTGVLPAANGGPTANANQLLVVQAAGGASVPRRARSQPARLFQSGPAAGIVACDHLARVLGRKNAITADVGGTTFDVGLIVEGEPITRATMTVNQYDFHNRSIDVRSIGAGGGSKIDTDARTGAIRVGPESAGAKPGPACYGRGGEEPTLTDAMLALGFIRAESSHSLALDVDAALDALARVGSRVDMSGIQLARAALAIAEHQMAELIHQVTIGRGLDPRDFSLFAFGGGGPLHAAALARELAIGEVIVPFGDLAAVWSAYGASVAPLSEVQELAEIQVEPCEPQWLQDRIGEVRQRAIDALVTDGAEADDVSVALTVDVRYRTQIHVVEVPVTEATRPEELFADFDRRYESLYGRGSGYRAAGRQIVSFRCRASVPPPPMREVRSGRLGTAQSETVPTRMVHWRDDPEPRETPVYAVLPVGMPIVGPLLVELGSSTLCVHAGQLVERQESGVLRVVPAGEAS